MEEGEGADLAQNLGANVIVLSNESDNDDDIILCEDVQIDYNDSESILLPVSPAKKVFTPTKRLWSSPTSDNSDSDDLDEGERCVLGLRLILHGNSCDLINVCTYKVTFSSPIIIVFAYDHSKDSLFSNSEDKSIYANEKGPDRYD